MFGLHPGWLWAIGGVLLLIAEVIAPGFFLVFIGAAAIATGLFTVLFDLGIAPQLGLFVIYAALLVMVGQALVRRAGRAQRRSAAQRTRRADGRPQRDGRRGGRRAWRPGPRRRRRMERPRRSGGARRPGPGRRHRRQLPDCRSRAHAAPCLNAGAYSVTDLSFPAAKPSAHLPPAPLVALPAVRRQRRRRRRRAKRRSRALLDSIAENLLRLSAGIAPRRWASTQAPAPHFARSLRIEPGRPGPGRGDASRRSRPRRSDRHLALSPFDPHQRRSCAQRLSRPRSKASPSPMATSPSAAGATRPMSSSRTSAPISTSRASSTATIRSRMPPTPKPISRASTAIRPARRRARPHPGARGKGLVPAGLPDRQGDHPDGVSLKGAREGGGLVESIERRTRGYPRRLGARARAIAQQKVAPALERQIAELTAQRPWQRWTPACGRVRAATIFIAGRSRPRPRPP